MWLHMGPESTDSACSTSYACAPVQDATVVLAGEPGVIALVPIGDSGVVNRDGLTVFAAVVADENTLVAMDSTAAGRPVWTSVVDGDLSECTVRDQAIDCGPLGVFDVLTGPTDGADAEPNESGATQGTAAPEEENGSGSAAQTPEEADGATQVADDDASALEPTPDAETPHAGTPSAETPHAGTVTEVPTHAGEGEAFYLDGHTLLDSRGKEIATFARGPVWQINNEAAGGNTWAFTDGSRIVVVRGGKVAWEEDGARGSLAVNAEATPDLAIGTSALLVGDEGGLSALDLATGEEVWRLDAPLDSWFARGDTLLIAADGDVHLMSFPDSDADSGSGSGTGSDSGEGVGGAGSPSFQTLTSPDLPTAPTYEDFANGELEIPDWLASELGFVNGPRVPLRDGLYDQITGGKGTATVVVLHEVEPLYVGGDAYAVALWSYGLRQSDNLGAYWSVYDADQNLVAAEYLGWIPGVVWTYSPVDASATNWDLNAWFRPAPTGSFRIEMEMGMFTEFPSTADVTWKFDGAEAKVEGFALALASGKVSRAPDMAQLQSIYDALSEGRDDEAAPYVDASVLRDMQEFATGSGMSYRELALAPGGKVEKCVLASPGWDFDYPPRDENDVGYGSIGTSGPDLWALPPGTWYCGLSSDIHPVGTDWDGASYYLQYFVVRTDEDGVPFIEGINRNYQ